MALVVPLSVYGLGLGNMTVRSALDQPFLAEIELLDVGGVVLNSIKVGVADPENFEEIGLERTAALSLLRFSIANNKVAKPIIKIQSQERMTEPYLALVLDLTWPKGQLYKAYTILLDPPGYRLVNTIIAGRSFYRSGTPHRYEPGVIDKTVITTVNYPPSQENDSRKQSTYGPTVANESVWQIAQRYKTSAVILPQVVLAIVGENPEAFKEGNLNGLHVGSRLIIPATKAILTVPADLATAEVMAQDKAWNDKLSTEHVLSAPYMQPNSTNTAKSSTIPYPKDMTQQAPLSAESTLPAIPKLDVQAVILSDKQPHLINPGQLPNPLLEEKLIQHTLQVMDEAAKNVTKPVAKNTIASASTATTAQPTNTVLLKKAPPSKWHLAKAAAPVQMTQEEGSDWSTSLLLAMLVAGGLGFVYWYFKIRKPEENADSASPLIDPTHPKIEEGTTQVVEASIDKSPEGLSPVEKEVELPVSAAPSSESLPSQEVVSDDSDKPFPSQHELTETPSLQEESASQNTLTENEQQPLTEHAVDLEPLAFQIEDKSNNNTVKKEQKERTELDASHDDLIEFEEGLHKEVTPDFSPSVDSSSTRAEDDHQIEFVSPKEKTTKSSKAKKKTLPPNPENEVDEVEDKEQLITKSMQEVDDSIINFFNETEAKQEQPPSVETDKSNKAPLKNKKALDTLLDLAKTYISMDDHESAKASLEEVLEYGSKTQKTEAQQLLNELKD